MKTNNKNFCFVFSSTASVVGISIQNSNNFGFFVCQQMEKLKTTKKKKMTIVWVNDNSLKNRTTTTSQSCCCSAKFLSFQIWGLGFGLTVDFFEYVKYFLGSMLVFWIVSNSQSGSYLFFSILLLVQILENTVKTAYCDFT